jgi:hypothetical protein
MPDWRQLRVSGFIAHLRLGGPRGLSLVIRPLKFRLVEFFLSSEIPQQGFVWASGVIIPRSRRCFYYSIGQLLDEIHFVDNSGHIVVILFCV